MIMKKMMIVALMAAAASTAFAGDSPALKSILKAKTYAEASGLLQSSLGQLASNAEKAKAYNKLVDLAMATATKEKTAMDKNVALKGMQGAKLEPVDSLAYYTALGQAFDAAAECEKFDQMPNDKGKVAPKFHDSNVGRLLNYRLDLINGGIYFQEKGNMKNAYKYLADYVDTHDAPLFAKEVAKTTDENLYNIAYYAAVYAYQNKDIKGVQKYCDIAMKDEKYAKDANNLKLAVVQESLRTREDSLNYVKDLEGQFAADPNNETVFGTLVNMYSALKMNDQLNKVFDQKLQSDPDNFVVWAVRGQNAMMDQKLDEAVEYFKKALVQQPENPQILTYLGACQLDRGSAAENRAAGKTGRVPEAAMSQIRPIYEEALGYLQKAKELDPTKEKANWGYPLYRCCYQLYGADDPRTKDAEAHSSAH